MAAPYVEADPIWTRLEPRSFAVDGHTCVCAPVALLSANWLRTQRPSSLPERQRLPPEAFVPLAALKGIHAITKKGAAKGLVRPLPIICILHPRMPLANHGSMHPEYVSQDHIAIRLWSRSCTLARARLCAALGANLTTCVPRSPSQPSWPSSRAHRKDVG